MSQRVLPPQILEECGLERGGFVTAPQRFGDPRERDLQLRLPKRFVRRKNASGIEMITGHTDSDVFETGAAREGEELAAHMGVETGFLKV